MYLISPGVGAYGVGRRRDRSAARRMMWAGAAIVLVAVALFAVGSRRVEAAGSAARPSSGDANAANYPVTVHVTGSYWNLYEGLNTIDVTIDSVKYKLVRQRTSQMIATGDYHARLVTRKQAPGAYIANGQYEFLFPDGKTAQFYLCGEWEQ